jgi:soluble lytic murein transglycosylase-like protein
MLDPSLNVEYAAKFLKRLYEENENSWHRAVKYYHSRTSSKNKIYSRKIAIAWIQSGGVN